MDNSQVGLGDTRLLKESAILNTSTTPTVDCTTKQQKSTSGPLLDFPNRWLGLHPALANSTLSSPSGGTPCSTDLLYPSTPQDRDEHASTISTSAYSPSWQVPESRYEGRRSQKRTQSASESDAIQEWSQQWPLLGPSLPDYLLQGNQFQTFRALERRSCPNITCLPTRNQPRDPVKTSPPSSPNTWNVQIPVTDEAVSAKQLDDKATGTRRRRWTLQHKVRPSRAVSRASYANGAPTPLNENSRIIEGEVHLGVESFQRPKTRGLGHSSTPTKKHSHESRLHVDTPAMITLRRASTRVQDSRMTLLSQVVPVEEQTQLLKPPEVPKIGAYFSRSYHPKVSAVDHDRQTLRLLPQKSRLAEPATTIAELQITQKTLDESDLSEPELRRRKSGYSKIYSGKTFHEVIWEDYASSSSSSSRSCQSENCVLRSTSELRKGTGVEVRRFSLPHLPITLIDQLKDVHLGLPKRSDSVLVRRQSFADLLALTKPLQKMIAWTWKGREATESTAQYASTTQTPESSLSFIPRRATDPFATILEDNGYTAAVDRVEFFPPLESRRASLTSLGTGSPNLDNPCVWQSEGAFKSAPKLPPISLGSFDVSPLDEALAPEFKLGFQNPEWNTVAPSTPEMSLSRRKSSLQPRPSMGYALGSSAHRRKRCAEVQKTRFEVSRGKGKSSDALESLGTKAPRKHSALPGIPKRSKSDMGELFSRRAKSLDTSSRAYTMMDLLSPIRYVHQLSQRRKSSGTGGLREAGPSTFEGTLLSPTEEFPPTEEVLCSGDACTPVSVDWIG